MNDPRLLHYLELLLEKNNQVNLTAARSLEELRVRHLEDCLQLVRLPEVQKARYLLDVGTGGGLPGIPAAIALPNTRVTMLDATQKKVAAVQGFVDALGLKNAGAVAGRAEDLGHHPEWRQVFDVVTSRAFAAMPQLLEYCAPFVRPGGHLVAFKGPDAHNELEEAQEAIRLLSAEVLRVEPYQVRDQQFNLVVLRVNGPVARRYPRSQALIRNHPLNRK